MNGQERLFRGLLRLYPTAFRARYGDEILQLCADEMRDARGSGARRGPLQTLLETIIDVSWCGLHERASNRGAAAPTPTMRLLGLLGIAGGLILVSGFLFFIHPTFNLARLLLFNAGAIGITVAVCRLAGDRIGRWALAIAAFVVVANLAHALGSVYAEQFEFPFAGLRGIVYSWISYAMWLGDGAFGLVALRVGGFARVGGLALALGAFGLLGIDRFWAPTELAGMIAMTGVVLNGFGWIVLGLVVALRGRDESARVGAPGPA